MKSDTRSRFRFLGAAILGVTLITNLLGIALTFTYFSFIESALQNPEVGQEFHGRPLVLAITVVIIFIALLGVTLRILRSIWADLRLSGVEPKKVRLSIGALVGLPITMAGLSLLAWIVGAMIHDLLPELVRQATAETWYRSLRVFFGIVLVGSPFTVLLVYFFLEWMVRHQIQLSLPYDLLEQVPESYRINVLQKLLIVCLIIGTVPVSIISYVSLRETHKIQAGVEALSTFVSHMHVVIGFLLGVAVLLACVLSVFLAKSICEPLRQIGSAMEKIEYGDLDVKIPVLSNDEIGFLAAGFNRMAKGLRERDFIRETFGSYLSPDVVAEILGSPQGVVLGGELREVTILVCDLRGFTSFASSNPPDIVVAVLNLFFQAMVEIIMSHDGTIDEFTGDGIVAFFGVPRRIEDSELRAVTCALEMQQAMPDLNGKLRKLFQQKHTDDGLTSGNGKTLDSISMILKMGIGVSAGTLIVGNIGSDRRKKYGAVGTPINLAFRIESLTKGGEVIISDLVYDKVAHTIQVEPIHDAQLKGIQKPITLYRVVTSLPT